MDAENIPVVVVGLGYVGLPLAVAFGSRRETIGFDVSQSRVGELRSGIDRTGEVSRDELARADQLRFVSELEDLGGPAVFVVAVPTPVDEAKRPNLAPLIAACGSVGRVMKAGSLVVFESTVYPGATEEDCVPILEAASGLVMNVDFHVGYSPERVNPGDPNRRLAQIVKITSGSDDTALERVDLLYRSVIDAGTYRASSIKVAEAAKVIENTQRDLNIALVNELAIVFAKMGLDTAEVLAAAETKWNFLPFRPGLVGGHCIGVDPYYLTHRAQEFGYHPEVILAGRRINDLMGSYVADQMVLLLAQRGKTLARSRVLVLGLAFKENCADVRNTRVVDIIDRLRLYGVDVSVSDPWVDPKDAESLGVALTEIGQQSDFDGVVVAVAHEQFKSLGSQARDIFGADCVIYDVKALWPRDAVDARL